jgi:hypothetical protein
VATSLPVLGSASCELRRCRRCDRASTPGRRSGAGRERCLPPGGARRPAVMPHRRALRAELDSPGPSPSLQTADVVVQPGSSRPRSSHTSLDARRCCASRAVCVSQGCGKARVARNDSRP